MCFCVREITYAECLTIVWKGAEYAELRLDLVTLSPAETHSVSWTIAKTGLL
jgi:hypothetical protein